MHWSTTKPKTLDVSNNLQLSFRNSNPNRLMNDLNIRINETIIIYIEYYSERN